jgi:hypothetical protein
LFKLLACIGIDSAGVGCVGIHPLKNKVAVGGKGFQPRILIYSYPDKEVILMRVIEYLVVSY